MTKPLSLKLRVTLHVSKEFEGAVEVFVYDTQKAALKLFAIRVWLRLRRHAPWLFSCVAALPH